MKLTVLIALFMSFFVTPVSAERNQEARNQNIFVIRLKVKASTATYDNVGGWMNGYLGVHQSNNLKVSFRCGDWFSGGDASLKMKIEDSSRNDDEQVFTTTMADEGCSAYISEVYGRLQEGATTIELRRPENGKAILIAY